MGIKYLSIPYSHPDPEVRAERARVANEVAASMISEGDFVFSPISHGHAIFGECPELDPGPAYWKSFEAEIIPKCEELVVVVIAGFFESLGVKREIELAESLGIPVRFLEEDEAEER